MAYIDGMTDEAKYIKLTDNQLEVLRDEFLKELYSGPIDNIPNNSIKLADDLLRKLLL